MIYTTTDQGRDLRRFLKEREESNGKLLLKDYEEAIEYIYSNMSNNLSLGRRVRLGKVGFVKVEQVNERIVHSNLPNVKNKVLKYPAYIRPELVPANKLIDDINKDFKTIEV